MGCVNSLEGKPSFALNHHFPKRRSVQAVCMGDVALCHLLLEAKAEVLQRSRAGAMAQAWRKRGMDGLGKDGRNGW